MSLRIREEIQALSWRASVISFDRFGATRAEAIAALRGALVEAGVETPALDARLLVRAAGGLAAADLIREPNCVLSVEEKSRLRGMAERRIAREPISRILQNREFWGLPLAISPDVLDPRPDTETLVEAVLETFASRRDEPLRILDMGVGSGALLCALLSELPNAFGLGLDISQMAAQVARDNLSALGFADRSCVIVGAWTAALNDRFDIVVSNPPYIASHEIGELAPEVRIYDPIVALDGGADGLDAYRAISVTLGHCLAPKAGAFFLEIGAGQAASVKAILAAAGLGALTTRSDLGGRDRMVQGRPLLTEEFALSEDATWRGAKKRLMVTSESSSPRSPSESRAAAG
jgi:release factor glutamine methyltransferase